MNGADIAALQRQVEEQREKINHLSQVVNYLGDYMGEYRESHNVLYSRFLYALTMWLRRVEMPMYRRPLLITQLHKHDAMPIMRADAAPVLDSDDAPVFDDEFLDEPPEQARVQAIPRARKTPVRPTRRRKVEW